MVNIVADLTGPRVTDETSLRALGGIFPIRLPEVGKSTVCMSSTAPGLDRMSRGPSSRCSFVSYCGYEATGLCLLLPSVLLLP